VLSCMELSTWAKKNGLTYKTAWRLFKEGKLPLPAEQLATGTILVHGLPTPSNNVTLYTRVSSGDRKTDLDRRMQRLRDYVAANGLRVMLEVQEVGSGLNGQKKKLLKILSNPSILTIPVEHRDRLARFGSEYIEAAQASSSREVKVINDLECRDDLVQDMVDILTSFCALLYGKDAAKNRVVRAKKALL